MSAFTSALARRGFEAAHASFTKAGDGEEKIQIPVPAVLLLLLTSLVFFGLLFAISYTYGSVVTTLCMIEEPQTNAYIPVNVIPAEESAPPAYSTTPNDSVPKQNATGPVTDDIEVDEVLLIRSQPITSSLRATIAHLRARAGYCSRFRGLSIFVCFNILRGLITSVLASIPGLRNRGGMAVAAIVAEVILSRWHMTWIHIVISESSPKRWYQRIPPLNTWKRIAPVVAVYAVTMQIAHGLPLLICQSFSSMKHMRNPEFEPGRKDMFKIFGQSLMGIFLVLGFFVLLVIPANVTLVRVAASMLPDEDETIVPFDRTFGGKVTPAIIGGSGRIGMLEAWRSFPWEGRKRLLKLIAKVFLLLLSVWVLFAMVIITEAHLVLGDKLGEVMKAVHRHMGPH
jgi:hypothetical protein